MQQKPINVSNLKIFSLDERVTLIAENLGVSDSSITQFHDSNNPTYQKILDAAEFIYTALKKKGLNKHEAMAQITSGTLATFLYPDDNLSKAANKTASIINIEFTEDMQAYGQKLQVELTSTEMVRINIFENVEDRLLEPNSAQARSAWGESVKFSYQDLIRGTRIPQQIDNEVAFLLGAVFYGARQIVPQKFSFRLSDKGGKNKNYFGNLASLIEKHFTIVPTNQDKLHISSRGIYTWVESLKNANDLFPNFYRCDTPSPTNSEELEKAFLYGSIATRGRFAGKDSIIKISSSKDLTYLVELQELANRVGFQPSIYEKDRTLYFGAKDVSKIRNSPLFENSEVLHVGGFVNPKHIEFLNQ